MPANELVELLIPYWQSAGYEVNLDSDRSWLESLTAMVTPNLTRLANVVEETKLLFGESVEYSDEAIEFLKQEGVDKVLQEAISAIEEANTLETTDAKGIIKQVTKSQKVKKGLVMRSLRAGLTGEMHGPDLIQSWVLLNQKQLDRGRLSKALSLI